MSEILIIDNLDSFTYNLVDIFRKNNYKVFIFRNYVNQVIIEEKLNVMNKPILIFSPGPGKPRNSGCMPFLIKKFMGVIPMIGICLGHQAIIEAYGGNIIQSRKILHGKTSLIEHDNEDMYKNIINPFFAGRYHSLVCTEIPKNFIVNSRYKELVMSVKNTFDKVCGFQFHPESILTTLGDKILLQTINWIHESI